MQRALAALILASGAGMAGAQELVLSGGGQELTLSAADIVSVTGEAFGAEIVLTVTLTDAVGAALAEFTATLVGQEVAILSCGTELTRPRLVEAITGGSLTIAGLSDPVARRVVSVMEGKAPCAK